MKETGTSYLPAGGGRVIDEGDNEMMTVMEARTKIGKEKKPSQNLPVRPTDKTERKNYNKSCAKLTAPNRREESGRK